MEAAAAAIIALGATPLYSDYAAWLLPLVQTIHLLGISVILGSVGMFNLRLLGLAARTQPLDGFAHRLFPWIWMALVAMLITGTLLLPAGEVPRLESRVFLTKMFLLALAVTLTAALEIAQSRRAGFWDRVEQRPPIARTLAAVSLLLWCSVAIAGRLIFIDAGPE